MPLDKKISHACHGYYRKVIVPAIRDHCGYEGDAEAHRALKAGFYDLHPFSPEMPSMADISQEEAGRFIDYALRQAAEMGLVLPDPARKELAAR